MRSASTNEPHAHHRGRRRATLDSFDAIIDARSESEYAEDRLPGALNWPSLHDDERRIVGTRVQAGVRLRGAQDRRGDGGAQHRCAHRTRSAATSRTTGGRSCTAGAAASARGSLALVLDQIGFRVHVLEGGYKAFRAAVVARSRRAAAPLRISRRVRAHRQRQDAAAARAGGRGRAGARPRRPRAASRLRARPHSGPPAADAEGVRDARSGTCCAASIRRRPVFVESESKKVGNLRVPEALIERMRCHSSCLRVEMPDEARVQLAARGLRVLRGRPRAFLPAARCVGRAARARSRERVGRQPRAQAAGPRCAPS